MSERQQADLSPRPSSRKIAFGASALGFVSIAKMLLQMAALPVMARLLGPTEFGLYAIAIPIVAFVGTLSDGGLGVSLVKEPESSSIWSTAFWALLGIGIVLAACLTGAGFALGVLLHQPRLPGIMAALSVTIVLMTITVPPVARLDRQGRIAVGAGSDLLGNILGTCFGIFLAFHGAGAWSLVGQYVTIYVMRALVCNCAAFKMPKMEFHPAALISHLATGGFVVGVRISDFAGRMLENIGLSHVLGTAAVGLYAFSNQIPRFISETFSNPLWLSLYIRALREEKAEIVALHRQFSRLLGMILFPVTALFLVTAPALIPMFLGPKWVSAAPLLQILLPAYVLNVIGSQNGAVLLACNRYDIQLYCTIGASIGKVLAVCLAPWIGLIGVAYGVAGVNAIYAIVMIFGSAAITGCEALPVLRGLAGPLAASLFAGTIGRAAVGPALLNYGSGNIGDLVLCLTIGTVAYIAAIVLLDRKHLASDLTLLKNVLRPRRVSPAS
jgi:PST family polysaccharide transporter